MKRITILLTIFLLLSTSTVAVSVDAVSLNRSFLEKRIDMLHPLSRIREQIDGKFQNFQKKICNFYENRRDDGPDGFVFSPEDIELKDDAFHGSDALHFTE